MAYASAKSILLRRHGGDHLHQDEQLPYRYVTAEGEASVELLTPEGATTFSEISLSVTSEKVPATVRRRISWS